MYSSFIRPLLFLLPPETVHHLSLEALRFPFTTRPLRTMAAPYIPGLRRMLWGLDFPNPFGLAAGFDKNAVALPAWQNLGFGFVELGTVTPRPQPGNPTPRVFRLPPEQGIINRLGFPNEGAETVERRLRHLRAAGCWPTIPVGINIGKNKATSLEEAPADYLQAFRILREQGDYFVVNVSSPNTPGLRALQQADALDAIFKPLVAENAQGCQRPLLVKIAPDLTETQIDEVVACALRHGLDGIVATNTTIDKSGVSLKEEGGLSGRPLTQRSTEVIRQISRSTGGRLPIIGVGGIFTGDDAKEKLDAGASLLQLYTSFVYRGPLTVRYLSEELMNR